MSKIATNSWKADREEKSKMADAKYEAIFVGGGNKAPVTAMYLARYGGMKIGIFERRHEMGGG